MKQTVNFTDFCDAFRIRDNNFTYDGKKALFDYIEEYEEGTGQETELDVVALCCEYTEYSNLEEFQADYNNDNDYEYESIEDIEEATTVIKIDDESFIIQAF